MSITETNRRIIECLASGQVYKQVAANTGLKERTVKERIRILKKEHNCTTIAQLVVEYQKKNIPPKSELYY